MTYSATPRLCGPSGVDKVTGCNFSLNNPYPRNYPTERIPLILKIIHSGMKHRGTKRARPTPAGDAEEVGPARERAGEAASCSNIKESIPSEQLCLGIASEAPPELSLSLQIKWSSGDGDGRQKTKINRLHLRELENVDKLGE